MTRALSLTLFAFLGLSACQGLRENPIPGEPAATMPECPPPPADECPLYPEQGDTFTLCPGDVRPDPTTYPWGLPCAVCQATDGAPIGDGCNAARYQITCVHNCGECSAN